MATKNQTVAYNRCAAARLLLAFLLLPVTLLWFSATAACALTIETVVVGNPGNAGNEDFGLTGVRRPIYPLGVVDYVYKIGKFEVTNSEYSEFLNAVAKTDTHGLYNSKMGTRTHGGISRTGTSGNYSYTPRTNMANKPVNLLSYWDMTRFCNWLHNGQPTGLQDNSTTEDGAYTLGGVTNPPDTDISRNEDAQWFIPSQNEWYKAAFHQPATEGGDVDDYWMFPTRTNEVPVPATANEMGEITNPGPNVVNHLKQANWNGTFSGNVTTVGSAGPSTASFYGTFDQAGNLWEYYDRITLGSPPNVGLAETKRGIWGGGWISNISNAQADHNVHSWEILNESYEIGFRVASISGVPPLLNGDFNGDGSVDAADYTVWQDYLDLDSSVLNYNGSGETTVVGADFLLWQTHFGDSLASGSSVSPAPEPTTLLLTLLAMIAIHFVAGRGSRASHF